MAQTGLIAAIDGYTRRQGGESPYFTEVEGLILLRADGIRPPSHIISRPALCLVVQGAKRTSFGDETHAYGPGEAMIVT
ncbi:AraC family transcriptional regulator, partial [Thioclava sp. BHET1]